MPIVIDPEFASLLPKKTDEELARLEGNLIRNGCRHKLVVWVQDGQPETLIDGHNRYEICTRQKVPFDVERMRFGSREDVIEWIVDEQLSRRNLTAEQRAYYVGKKYLNEKKKSGGRPICNKGSTVDPLSGKTADRIAEEHDVSPTTVKNAANFAKAVDALDKAQPGAKDRILAGKGGTRKDVIGSAPVLCDRCEKSGIPARDCRWCAEAADLAATKKRAKVDTRTTDDPRHRPVAPSTESPDAELLPSMDKGGGHPFLTLKANTTILAGEYTRAMTKEGEDHARLYQYAAWCGLLDHDPKKGGLPKFLPLMGVSKVCELAGQGGPMLTQAAVVLAYQTASGGFVPPLTARRRKKKGGKK